MLIPPVLLLKQVKAAPDSASVALLLQTVRTILPEHDEALLVLGPSITVEMESAFRASFDNAGAFSTLIHGDLCPVRLNSFPLIPPFFC